MKKYLLAFAVCVSFFVRGQETGYLSDYIVTKSNDTIRGQVRNRKSQTINFKRNSESDGENYTADQLVCFQAGEKLYVSRPFDDHQQFWEVIARGPLWYYEYITSAMGARGMEMTVHSNLQRENENYSFDSYGLGPRSKERLLAYFANEPSIVENIKKGMYHPFKIDRLVRDYNVLKFKASKPASSKRVMLTCYTRTPKNADSLILQVNDDQQYRFGKNKMMTVYIPENTPTKLCFGTRDKKECEIVYTLPFNSNPRFYELSHNGNFGKFGIDQKSAASAQRDISLMMRPKVDTN